MDLSLSPTSSSLPDINADQFARLQVEDIDATNESSELVPQPKSIITPPRKTATRLCSHCDKEITSPNWRRHQQEVHSESSRKFACAGCDKVFKRWQSLIEH
jgi:hypothetical protein